jgi:hypothetical protein
VDYGTFDCVRLARCFGEFACVLLPNPIEINRTISVRFGPTSERAIDYVGLFCVALCNTNLQGHSFDQYDKKVILS